MLFAPMRRGDLPAWTGRRLRAWCTAVLLLGVAGTVACVSLELRFYGDTSLSAYLWHYPVLLLVTRAGLIGGDTPLGVLWSCALVLGVTTAVAWVSRRLVEEPAMRAGDALDSRSTSAGRRPRSWV